MGRMLACQLNSIAGLSIASALFSAHPMQGHLHTGATLKRPLSSALHRPLGLALHVALSPHRACSRLASSAQAQSATGGGNGPVGGKKSTGGGGSSGGGNSGGGSSGAGGSPDEGSKEPKKSGLLQGWEQRVAYDPEFPVKVLLEQIIGVGASVIGDMSSRPNWGLNELDFVFSTLVVGSIMNFSIMYLLAPTAGAAAVSVTRSSFLTRALSDQTLKAWGAPGGNMFEKGTYTVASRLLNLGYKGVVFSAFGFIAGVTGTALSNSLLVMRKTLDPNFKLVNEQPNIFANAGTWGLHMGMSANLRYQLLGGVDPIVAAALPLPLFRVYQAGIRALNNVVGGISFVTLARVLGVQKSAAGPTPPQPALVAAVQALPVTKNGKKANK